MNILRASIVLLLLASSFSAEARPRRHHHHARVHSAGPRVTVLINPWAPTYAPAPRPGWVWVAGVWVGPRWRPGYWQPAIARPGWLWVAGYWAGTVYVDGYWREASRHGQVWVDGYYDDNEDWVPGYWAPAGSADAARDEGVPHPADEPPAPESAPVFHDYE